jgi:ribosomal-protein-alanine N-acetyltransferase
LPALKFEPLTGTHTAEVFQLWSDFDAVRLTNWTHTPTLDACSERIAKVVAYYRKEPLHFGPYAIRETDGRFVGIAGADLADSSAGEYDVWYFVSRANWGRGVATQALRDLVGLMSASGRVKAATASAVLVNTASCRLLERLGFTRIRVVSGGFQRHGMTGDLCGYRREFNGGESALGQGAQGRGQAPDC